MGLFRKNRSNSPANGKDTKEEDPNIRVKFTVVVLEFPPNFDATTAAAERNPRIIFQHETDSVVSDVSNCSCRIMMGRRRPECCTFCAEMRESAIKATPPPAWLVAQQPEEQKESPDLLVIPAIEEDPTFSMSESSVSNESSQRQKHRIPPAITLLSKLVPTPRRRRKAPVVLVASASPKKVPTPLILSEDSGIFRKPQSVTLDDISLDHELA